MHERPPSGSTSVWVPALLAALAALAHAGFDLDRRSVWLDEAESIRFSQSLPAMIEDWNAFFYYVLLWAVPAAAAR